MTYQAFLDPDLRHFRRLLALFLLSSALFLGVAVRLARHPAARAQTIQACICGRSCPCRRPALSPRPQPRMSFARDVSRRGNRLRTFGGY